MRGAGEAVVDCCRELVSTVVYYTVFVIGVQKNRYSPLPPALPLQTGFKSFAAALTTTLTTCLEHCLRAVPGSYLCRTWEGELKYMCAFTDAQVRTRGFSGLRV